MTNQRTKIRNTPIMGEKRQIISSISSPSQHWNDILVPSYRSRPGNTILSAVAFKLNYKRTNSSRSRGLTKETVTAEVTVETNTEEELKSKLKAPADITEFDLETIIDLP